MQMAQRQDITRPYVGVIFVPWGMILRGTEAWG
jgi:hypothetical protein